MFYFGSNTKRDLDRLTHEGITRTAIGLASGHDDVQFFLLPSIPFFLELKEITDDSKLWIGNQSISSTSGTDVTGEISGTTLKALGSDLVMIGHAERRARFDGPDEISQQLHEAQRAGLRVLFCVGESTHNDDEAQLKQFLTSQLLPLVGLANEILIAYEPVFAIGANGVEANPSYVGTVVRIIKEIAAEIGHQSSPILYGGSVNQANAATYASLQGCDGLFVGRSAWSPKGYAEVFTAGYNAYKSKVV